MITLFVNFIQIVKIITKAENISKMNRLEQIDKTIIPEILNEE